LKWPDKLSFVIRPYNSHSQVFSEAAKFGIAAADESDQGIYEELIRGVRH